MLDKLSDGVIFAAAEPAESTINPCLELTQVDYSGLRGAWIADSHARAVPDSEHRIVRKDKLWIR